MSVNWDSLIKGHFKNKNKINFGALVEMVSKHMEAPLQEGEKSKGVTTKARAEKFLLSLPKFTPSEAWGKPNSQARIEMERYFKRIGGRGLQGKLDWLARVQEPPGTPAPHVQRVISTLIILESLASCVNDFSEPSAGFVFEGFLAILLGGYQVSDPVSGNLPIEDVMAFSTDELGGKGTPMSLKLLRGGGKRKPKEGESEESIAETGGGAVKGSYTNLVDAINKYGEMLYIVAYKKSAGNKKTGAITIGEFKITQANLLGIISTRKLNIEKLLKITDRGGEIIETGQQVLARTKSMGWEELYPILQHTAGYSRTPIEVQATAAAAESIPLPKPEPEEAQPGPLSEGLYPIVHLPQHGILAEGKSDIQWHLTQADLTKGAAGGWKELAVLNIDPEHLKKVVTDYTNVLTDEIMTLFETVKSLSENLNSFYVYENRAAGLKRGAEAAEDAHEIEEQASAQVEAEKGSGAQMELPL